MRSLACDIVLLPAAELAQQAIGISSQLAHFDALFQLGSDTYVPHVTLYMTQLKQEDIAHAGELLAATASQTPPLQLTATRYEQKWGYIDVEYDRSEALAALQLTIVRAINPLRDGMSESNRARLQTARGRARSNLERYGYRSIGPLFRPHLTFTRLADQTEISLDFLPQPQAFSGGFSRIGLFELGDNGTCIRQLAAFELGGVRE